MNARSRLLLPMAVACLTLVPGAHAQNRPACLPSPTGPGACFIDGTLFPSTTLSSVDGDGDYLHMVIPASADDFFSFHPNGRVLAHLTDTNATFTVCPATAPASCSTDGAGALTGDGRVQTNAFLAVGGIVFCPASITASGTVSNGTDDFELTYSLVNVPSTTGCRTLVDDIRITAN